MTSPPEEIKVLCPNCGHLYEDWWRPSMNLELEHFHDEYLEQATTSTCPQCGFKVHHTALIVRENGVWQVGLSDDAKEGT